MAQQHGNSRVASGDQQPRTILLLFLEQLHSPAPRPFPGFHKDGVGRRQAPGVRRRQNRDQPVVHIAQLHRQSRLRLLVPGQQFHDLRVIRDFGGFETEQVLHRHFQDLGQLQRHQGIRHVGPGFHGVNRLAAHPDFLSQFDG